MSVGKSLGQQFKAYIPDQRNHGQSFHHEEFNYEVMAEDLHDFVQQHQLEQPIVVGHSMGGKVAMFYAFKYASEVSKLIIVDVAPKAYPIHHETILEGMANIDITKIESRQEADRQLAAYVPEVGVRQFLLKNLGRKQQGGFHWKLNLPVISKSISNVGQALPEHSLIPNATLFVSGELSGYISDDDSSMILKRFPKAQTVTIPGAGHWVHAQKPQDFLQVLNRFLTSS